MKTIFKSIFAVLLALAINGITTGCSSSSTSDPAPVAACKLKTLVGTVNTQPQPAAGGGVASSAAVNATYDYDSQGRVIKSVETNAQSNYNSTITTNYIYNTDGFVTNSTVVGVIPGSTTTTVNTSYQYSNGKIASSAATTTGSSTTTRTLRYTYDTAGNLTTITDENAPSGSKYEYSYTNGILTTATYRPNTSGATIQPFTLSNGLITRSSASNSYSTYQYDAQDRQTRADVFVNGVINSYYTAEYDDMTPANQAIQPFKGYPVIKAMFGKSGVYKKYEYYAAILTGATPIIFNRTTTLNQANSRGMVTSSGVTNNQYLGSATNNAISHIVTSNTTYTYLDCN